MRLLATSAMALVTGLSLAAFAQQGAPSAPSPTPSGASGSTGQLPPAPPPPPTSASSAAPAASTSPPPGPPPPAPTAAPAPPATAPPPAPGYYYPPPGYYYPPPGYVMPGYWAPPPRLKPRYPDDASVQTSPFVDVLSAGVAWGERFDDFFTVGVQGGAYFAGRIRVVARLSLFLSQPDDNNYAVADYYSSGYEPLPSDSPSIVYGAALGAAPVVRPNFVFAPGIAFQRSDVNDYGTFFGLSLPFEWVTDDGARFGFEVVIGRAVGGSYVGRCQGGGTCTTGAESDFDRPAAAAFYGAFQFGWGFNHPPAKNPAE